MSAGLVIFLLSLCVCLVTAILILVRAFRASIWWGLIVMFVPFGRVVFVFTHWNETAKLFLVNVLSIVVAVGLLLGTSLGKDLTDASGRDRAGSANDPAVQPTPREVRDLAETEATVSAATPPDPNAVQRAAYAKHLKDLTAVYQQLNAERPKLKPGSPAVAAFNARLARYQQDLASVTEEKARLDTLDHSSNANAAAALASLQISAQTGDYEAFAATLKKSLSDYRQTPVFPQIVALARTTLQQATPDKVLAGFQNKATGAVRAEFDKTTRQVQAIVNQAPPVVAPPTGHKEVYHYAYHPGANKPDYNADNLIATREIWKGDYAYLEDVPGVFYRSADCEFNPQTKFFYLSRTVAKKKLSDAEYKELTRLYHLLGQQEKAMTDAPAATKDAERVSGDLAALKTQLDGYATK